MRIYVLVLILLALAAVACTVSIDVTTRLQDLNDVTHDLEYTYYIPDSTTENGERDESGVDDLGLFDSVHCSVSEDFLDATVTCTDLPHSMFVQSSAAGENTSIVVNVSRTDSGEQWVFRAEMVNPLADNQDEFSEGDVSWTVHLPGVIIRSNADVVHEDDGIAKFSADLEDSRDTFFAVSVQDKTDTPVSTTPISPFMCDNGVAVPDPANNPALVADCEALLSSRDILSPLAKLNWNHDTPISLWQGVIADRSPARVTGLYLYGRDLTGEIPEQIGDLSGLEYLWLHDNQLMGSIPAELGNLPSLEQLSLGHNRLSGEIPAELGNLTSLQYLSLSGNQLSGQVPVKFGNLSTLRMLWLYDNDLTGEIPAELGELSRLTHLSLSRNGLTGNIPDELGNLTGLRHLWLHNNDLTGDIPGKLGNLSKLQHLWLYQNDLTGSIPVELGKLSSLEYLSLSRNRLTGNIPVELGNLIGLRELWLHENDLTGEVPAELGALSSLEKLYLCGNRLTGTLPVEFGDLSYIETDGCVPASPEVPATPTPEITIMPTATPAAVSPSPTNTPPAVPTDVVAVKGTIPGTVQLTWNPVLGTRSYRIAWVAMPHYEAVTSAGRPWDESIVSVEIGNTGQDSYTVRYLVPGVEYRFAIAAADDRAGPWQWSQWTEPLILTATSGECPKLQNYQRTTIRP